MLTWANRITFFRLFCIPVFIGLILQFRERYTLDQNDPLLNNIRVAALLLFLFAVISDGVDGFLARFKNQKTLLGTILDPIADKLLLVSATIALSLPIGLKYQIPSWLTVTIVSRDILILLGALILFIIVGKVKFLPHFLGKLTTCSQMVTIVLVLMQAGSCTFFFYLTLSFTILSGLYYIYREAKSAGLNNNQVTV
ncbi:MAG: CDP-alcohol phosphatidyltransferase family protein [Candidatus Auribacterota bacterium]